MHLELASQQTGFIYKPLEPTIYVLDQHNQNRHIDKQIFK